MSLTVQGEGEVTLRQIYDASVRARRRKKPSRNQAKFDARWLDSIAQLHRAIVDGTWTPSPTVCFIAQRPKAREIHAPDFGDRVVHHWLVPQLEAIFEPRFIHDSYANRKGKGTHAAVRRLQAFVRQVYSGQGGGWYLQLDVRNFFNSIHRPTLWRILKRAMQRHDVPLAAQHVAHALIRWSPLEYGVTHRSSPARRARVPPHKRLESAAPGCGLPIGNLSSQFLANVYLDRLDQFAKHELHAARYVRYVDDFILVHRDRAQLEAWLVEIRRFLREELHLDLKADIRLRPLQAGIDFLGYVIYPTHIRVRRRVVSHARQALAQWAARSFAGETIAATPAELRHGRSVWFSYQGHFDHADAAGLLAGIRRRYPWLRAVEARRRFPVSLEGRKLRFRVH